MAISTEDGVRVGDYGTVFRMTAQDEDGNAVDLTTATSIQMRFRDPDGVGTDKPVVVLDATNGVVYYSTENGFIDMAGKWHVQLITTFASSEFYSNPEAFTVYDPLPAP